MMDKIYFLKKEKDKFLIFNSSSHLDFIDFKKSLVTFIVFVGFLTATLKYYVFISLYLSFRLYNLQIISLFFGFLAFLGAAYLIYRAISFSLFPISALIEINSQKYELKNISKFFLSGPKYYMDGEDFYAVLFFKGLFRNKLYFLNQNKEIIFVVEKEKNNFVFKRGKELFGRFSKDGVKNKIDLSKDLNSQIPPSAAFAACCLYLK